VPAARPQTAGTQSGPVPAVLLVSRAADREFDLVARQLSAAGLPVERLDAETVAETSLVIDVSRSAVQVRGRWITPSVTWFRHFSARAVPPDGRGAAAQIFAGQSWQALAEQLGTVAGMHLASRRPGTLEQLATARRCGVAVPRTVVTTDPASASRLLTGPRLVIKAVHQHFVEATPGLLTGVFPEIIDAAELAIRDYGSGEPPVLVQDYVEHDLEIRAYYVGGQIVTFAVGKAYPAQLWLHPEEVTAREIEPPAAVAAAVHALAAAMSLEYGAFDFVSAAGVPVFLEVNVGGDWCWLEAKASKSQVTAAVCALLAELHHRTRESADQVDPVSFLAGGKPG
jgi:hypothetical protein